MKNIDLPIISNWGRFEKVLFISILIITLPFSMQANRKISLNENWTFHQSGKEKVFDAKIPGVVHLDLIRHQQIPNPFYGTNEEKVQWIEQEDWVYEMSFDLEDLNSTKRYDLVFEGLDTYAEVNLNGQEILQADNMFRQWRVNVGSLLKKKDNQLVILFKSPLKVNQDKFGGPPYHKTAENDAGKQKVSVYTRKAPYHFGWDWGPRMVSCGIWKPVYLEEWDKIRISDVQVYQKELSENKAVVEATVNIENTGPGNFVLKIRDSQGDQIIAEQVMANPSTSLTWSVVNPQLWWPHNLGEPYIYHWELEVWEGGILLEKRTVTHGFRTIELIEEEDNIGKSFFFKVNGEPVFMKGANYIPSDALLPRRTKADIDRLLGDAKAVNMNMIRIWGGGIYEEDYFYQKCDELGILIWQDFMFACSMYPADEPFLSNIREEIKQNIRRLRNHPSIAIWCGNNEINVAWHNWGWQLRFLISKKDSQKMWGDYQTIFHQTIPGLLEELDPDRPYTTTSPLSNWGKLKNFNNSTMHFWGVWHGRQPFSDYKIYVGRFMSEYGFQSFPDWKTIEAFAPPEARNLESKVMKNHQKSYIGNGMIASHTRSHFRKPKNFQDFVYKSQLTQQIGIRTAIQSHRARKGHCMGTLFWQLNDCWPGPSWSSIDYFGRWKALHYDLQELYANILIVPEQDHQDLRIHVVSDELESQKAKLTITAFTLNGKKLKAEEFLVQIKANSSNPVKDINWKKFISGGHRKSSYLEIKLIADDKTLAETLHHFVVPRTLRLKKPKLDLQLEGNKVVVQTNTFVKGFYLFSDNEDLHFSQNYVDLQSGKRYEFEVKDGANLEEQNIKYLMVN